jgi:hypothetical protein
MSRGAGVKALLVLLVLVGRCPALQALEKKPKQIKVVGVATAIEPTRVTILSGDGKELSVVCEEDFTSKVGIGAQVTAWYHVKEGVNHLDWLEYPLESFFVPAEEIRSKIKKVIMLASTSVPDSDPLLGALSNYLETNLGWYIAPSFLAEEIRKRTQKPRSTLEDIDPTTGQFAMARYVEAQRELVAKLVSETRVDAVLQVDVEQVQAEFSRQVASWDGVAQLIATMKVRLLAAIAPFPEVGEVPAATVVMKLWDPQGKLLWTNRRGFAVLVVQSGVGNTFKDRPLTEVYKDQESVQTWLGETLGTLAPSKTPITAPQAAPAKKEAKK